MRPIGFESSKARLRQALVVGLMVGSGGALLATTGGLFASGTPAEVRAAVWMAGLMFPIGFAAGFGLRLTSLEYAPPQPKDDGNEEAGVPARLVPPVSPLMARFIPGSGHESA